MAKLDVLDGPVTLVNTNTTAWTQSALMIKRNEAAWGSNIYPRQDVDSPGIKSRRPQGVSE